MDELMDLMATDESPSQISDKLKDMLYAKSATKVDDIKSTVANSLFGDTETEIDDEDEGVEGLHLATIDFNILANRPD